VRGTIRISEQPSMMISNKSTDSVSTSPSSTRKRPKQVSAITAHIAAMYCVQTFTEPRLAYGGWGVMIVLWEEGREECVR
jgi:hypothetical protein